MARELTRREMLIASGSAGLAAAIAACAPALVGSPAPGSPSPVGPSPVGPSPSSSSATIPVTGRLALHERSIDQKISYWKALGDRFKQQNPGVEFEVRASGLGSAYNEALLTEIAAGTVGELFWVVDVENYLTFASKGVLEPLDDLIAQDGYDTSAYLPNVLDIYRQDGKILALPMGFHGGPIALFYNKDLFDSAKVDYPSLDWSYDDLAAAARKLARPDDGVFGYAMVPKWGEALAVLARNFGGDLLSEDGTKSRLTDPATKAAISWLSGLIEDRTHPRPTDLGPDGDLVPLFEAGKLAMFSQGPWNIQTLRQGIPAGGMNWDMSLLPKGSAGRQGQLASEAYPISISGNKPAAWEFLKLMNTLEEGLNRQAIGPFLPPPLVDAMTSTVLLGDPMRATYWSEVANNTPKKAFLPANRRVTEYFDLTSTAFDPLWLGEASVDETLASADKTLTDLLAKEAL